MTHRWNTIPTDPSQLDNFLKDRESNFDLKPGADAKILWSSKSREKTPLSMVYLHGFRASRGEGYPVHEKVAKKFGFNLFLARLEEHGLKTDQPLRHLTEEKLLDSARFALEVGRRIGEKVILMGTSTGGSLALYLAARSSLKPYIEGLVLYSPLIDFYGSREQLLTRRCFRRLLSFFPGEDHIMQKHQNTDTENLIWYNTYALQGALALGALVDHYMKPALFKEISCPVFVGYYYKNILEQDKVVSVSAIRKMIRATRAHSVNFSNAKTHVICNSFLSPAVKEVIAQSNKFIKSIVRQ